MNLLFFSALAVAVFLLRRLAWLSLRSAGRLIVKADTIATQGRSGERVRRARSGLSERYPRLSALTEARLTRKRFTGLALTLMVLAAGYIVALLGGLVEELIEAEELIHFDQAINQALGALRTDTVVQVFAFVTGWADASAIVAVAAVTTGLLAALGHGYLVVPLWVVVLGSQLTTYAGKYGFDRQRPEFVTEVVAATPSFPSGHATSAIAVYGFIAYVLSRESVATRPRFEIVFWSAVVVVLVGFSRMLLSLHYASDVVAGFLVGGFWLLVGFAIAELMRPGRGLHEHSNRGNTGLP